jgi:hypothetical protein
MGRGRGKRQHALAEIVVPLTLAVLNRYMVFVIV